MPVHSPQSATHAKPQPATQPATLSATQLGDGQNKASVERLLTQLLDQLAQTQPQPATPLESSPTHEVVLDLYLEGSRYTLTRMNPPPEHNGVNLSPREKEIVRLVCAGLPNKSISDVLEISPWTVGTYLKRIFAKLGVCSRAEMVARTLQAGLLAQHEYPDQEGWLSLLHSR